MAIATKSARLQHLPLNSLKLGVHMKSPPNHNTSRLDDGVLVVHCNTCSLQLRRPLGRITMHCPSSNSYIYPQHFYFSHRYLQKCGIQHIDSKAFKDLLSVNGLHLSRNNISELFPNTFRDLSMKIL